MKQAPVAIVNRKRKVAHNLPYYGKHRKSSSCSSEPKRVTAKQRIKKFPYQRFTVSARKLFCNACREEVALKKSIIEQHIKSEKHTRGESKLVSKEKREYDIAKALGAYDKEVPPVGEPLPTINVYFASRWLAQF